MPGRLFLITPLAVLCERFGAASALPPGPPRPAIAPGQDVPVLTPARQIVAMRWGLIPVGRVNARGRPVLDTILNARSETVFRKSAFAGTGRAVLLTDGWFEWTAADRGRKPPWRIAAADGGPLALAAISDNWTAPGGQIVPQVAPLTCEPNADIARIHDRMAVILDPGDVGTWLQGTEAQAQALARPCPPGRLSLTRDP